jgi:hypothetical protein
MTLYTRTLSYFERQTQPVRRSIVADRFWNNVNVVDGRDSCWEWQGSKVTGTANRTIAPKVYGRFYFSDKLAMAHRVSYLLAHDSIPKGKEICHTCDNGLCVRPGHLFAATHRENMLDCVRKGRNTKPRKLK